MESGDIENLHAVGLEGVAELGAEPLQTRLDRGAVAHVYYNRRAGIREHKLLNGNAARNERARAGAIGGGKDAVTDSADGRE